MPREDADSTDARFAVEALIPSRLVPLSLQRLVMEAGVNRDFAPIHHDMEVARASGAPGAFTNYVFLQSLVEFTVREWMGLDGRIERIALKLGGFNTVGAVLDCSGRIAARSIDGDTLVLLAAIEIKADGKVTTTGECEVRVPRSDQGKAE